MKLHGTYSTKKPSSNAFKEASKIEKLAIKDLTPFIKNRAVDGRFVFTNKGNIAKELQKTAGDVLFNCNQGKIWAIEVKAELENKTGNFFLESWSNKHWFTPGWMFTLQADILLYYFVLDKMLYSIPFYKLRQWAFGTQKTSGNIFKFQEKKQKKYNQLNDTWGWCVPIALILKQVKGCSEYHLLTEDGNQ